MTATDVQEAIEIALRLTDLPPAIYVEVSDHSMEDSAYIGCNGHSYAGKGPHAVNGLYSYIRFKVRPTHLMCTSLIVQGSERRKGIGKGLVQVMEHVARELKAPEIYLDTVLDDAHGFWHRMGYVPRTTTFDDDWVKRLDIAAHL